LWTLLKSIVSGGNMEIPYPSLDPPESKYYERWECRCCEESFEHTNERTVDGQTISTCPECGCHQIDRIEYGHINDREV